MRNCALRSPAPGDRAHGSGALWAVGNLGYSWSSAESGTNAHYLGFHCSWLTPQNANNRARGLPLRCLQE